MRSADDVATGYTPAALDTWAAYAQRWADGEDIGELPHAAAVQPANKKPRDVFVFFISSAKHRNPAAAMALQQRVDAAAG
jgi:uncharacterized protein YecE (DUF72 family)